MQGTDALIPRSSRYTGPIDCALQTLRSEGVSNFFFPSEVLQKRFDLLMGWLVQVAGLFRGGVTTFLRESLGNVMFFSVYEYIRHFMHLQLRDASSRHEGFMDLGIGIISGGLGGVAVCIMIAQLCPFFQLFVVLPAYFEIPSLCRSTCTFALNFSSFGLPFYPLMWQKPLSRPTQIVTAPEILYEC